MAAYQWLVVPIAIILLSVSFFASLGLLKANANDFKNIDGRN